MTFTREEADSLAMAFGVKNVWEINEGHVDENSTAQRVTWEVGEFPESVGDEVYEYQIIYLIKVFVVNACENLKWIRNESSYDQAFESETIMDPIETAYVICRRRCTEGERRVGFNYSEKEIIAELGSGINSQGQEKL